MSLVRVQHSGTCAVVWPAVHPTRTQHRQTVWQTWQSVALLREGVGCWRACVVVVECRGVWWLALVHRWTGFQLQLN